jgi:hypothetical protein
MALPLRTRVPFPQRLMTWGVIATAGLACMSAQAETSQPQDDEAVLKGWAFVFENDLIGTQSAKDRWYTNGLQLMLAYQPGREPALLKPVVSWGQWMVPQDCQGSGCSLTMDTTLGQSIYTPERLDVAEAQPQDRPWAGWLYGGVGLTSFSGNRQQALGLKIGVTGPASLAEKTQKGAHCCLGSSKEPLGWDNQLRPRLGVQLNYLSTHYHFVDGPVGLQSSWGGALGNIRTYVRGGLALTWSPAGGSQRGSQTGSLDEGDFFTPDFNAKAVDGSVWESLRHTVFFAHAQISAVAYNVFLQGRTYSGRTEIDPEHLVGTSTIGFLIPFGEQGRHKISLAWKRRTPEFKVPGIDTQGDRYQSWGVLSYSRDL